MSEPIRILIVEDRPTDAELAQREIRKALASCLFQQVETPEDYLAALESFRPDIIISDYTMPHFDGMTALKLALERVPLTPLIIWTGSLNEDIAVECMKAGAVNYVIKEHMRRLAPAVIHALEEKQLRVERRHAEDALRESEERFRSLYENAAIGIYRTTPDGHILMANPAAVRMLGYNSFDELAQHNLQRDRFEPTYSRDEFRDRLEREGVITGLESSWVRRDGSVIFVRESARAIRDEKGQVLYYDGTFEDITERKQAEEEIRRRTEQLATLHAIDTAIISNFDLRLTLNILLEHALTQLKADAAAVLLLNPSTQLLEYSASRGFRTKGIEESRLRVGEGSAGRAAFERRPVIVRNLTEAGVHYARAQLLAEEAFIFYCAVPLIAKDKIKGVIEVFLCTPFDPTSQWLDFFNAIATQAAIAIDSTQLFEDLQSLNAKLVTAYDETLEGWSRAMDFRDKETEGHTQRVTQVTLQLARLLDVGGTDLSYMRWGALLHDIGKIGIPDSILLKPDNPTDEEWAIMKKHPEVAYEMLSPISFLRPALDIPYCHHEKWDGTGYPRGLKGEEIPLAARIFAIADVWDALLSDRPYRKGWSQERMCQYVQDQAGKHFDPQVVDAFLKLIGVGDNRSG